MSSSSEDLGGAPSLYITRPGSTSYNTSLSGSNFNLSDLSNSTFPFVDPPNHFLESLPLALALLVLCVGFASSLAYLINSLRRQNQWLHNLLVDSEVSRINAQDVVQMVPVAQVSPQVQATVLPTVLPHGSARY